MAAPPAQDPNKVKPKIALDHRKKAPTAPVRAGDPILPDEDAPTAVEDPTAAPAVKRAAPAPAPPSYVKDWRIP